MKLVIFAALSVCAFAQTPAPAPIAPVPAAPTAVIPDDRVVLAVGGMEFTKKNFDAVLATIAEDQRNPNTKQAMLENLTSLLQVAQEARAAKFDADPVQAFQLKLRAEQSLAAAYLVDQMNKMGDDAFLKEWYSHNTALFSQWKARHILIRSQGSVVPVRAGMKDLTDAEALAKAKASRAKLVAGTAFAAVVKVDSDDSGSASTGGDLGFFGPGQMVAPMEEAVAKLKVNDISEPIKTEFGYHVVQLQEIRTKTFEEAKEEIRERSRQELQAKILASIKKKYPATVDPEYFGK